MRKLIITESDVDSAEPGDTLVYWFRLDAPDGAFSAPRLVDETGLELRREYLSWVFEMGRFEARGRRVASWMMLDEFGLSAWWLSLFVEKSPYKSFNIHSILKLRAIERLHEREACQAIEYRGGDSKMDRILKRWADSLGQGYSQHACAGAKPPRRMMAKRLYRRMPPLAQALAYLVRLGPARIRRIPLSARTPIKVPMKAKDSQSRLTIVTYFPNIDSKKAEKGTFYSHYWERLHDVLGTPDSRTDWIFLHSDSPELSFQDAIRLMARFKARAAGKDRFFLLEDFLNWKLVSKSVCAFLAMATRSKRMGSIGEAFRFPGSRIRFDELVQDDWEASTRGHAAFEAILKACLFEEVVRALQAQGRCLYLFEGQAWERALVHAWRRGNAGSTIAAQHSALRRMDFRAFLDPRTYQDKSSEACPLPDLIACNGEGARSLLLESGCPNERLRVVEALRYPYLAGRLGVHARTLPSTGRILLVITDFLESETREQLELLRDAAQQGGLSAYQRVILKSHPDVSIDTILREVPLPFEHQIERSPLRQLWGQADVVYCSNMTSAAIEAAWIGLPLICLRASRSMNLNPLVGLRDFRFAHSAATLREQLHSPQKVDIPADYFRFDDELKAWKALLGTV